MSELTRAKPNYVVAQISSDGGDSSVVDNLFRPSNCPFICLVSQALLHCHIRVGVAGGEGVVVGEDHVFGAVGAEGGFVVATDDGEGVEDVGGVCA